MQTDKVVFRKFRDSGDVIALFPELPADCNGAYCVSYQRLGQHGLASPRLPATTPATPGDYAPLKAELEQIGYRLRVVRKVTAKMGDARRAYARRSLAS